MMTENGNMKKCPSCGKTVNADAAFCTHCGTRLMDGRPNAKICSSCGEEMEPDAAFCTRCGTPYDRKVQDAGGALPVGTPLMELANDFLSVQQVNPTRFEFSSRTGAQAPVQKIKVKYEAVAQLDPANKQVIFWEKMVESSAGMNTGVFKETTVQKGIEVGKRIHGQLLFGGKYGFEYGKLREVVKAVASDRGWTFKTVILKPKYGSQAGEQASEKRSPVLKIFLLAVALLLIATFGAIAYLYVSDGSDATRSEEKRDETHQKNKTNGEKVKSPKTEVVQTQGVNADGGKLIKTNQDTYRHGEKIKVHYYNAPGGSRDWICIVPAGSRDTEAGSFQYIPKRGQGILVFDSPRPGKYEARAFYRYSSGQYKVTARHGFTIKD
ncbi:MAG: zinc ribbon domain-containing protein [Deltaproteobacteria bacterium]|nr:zinc ribbon domain-containing protein [Deltaproteobacteria bacterium]